MCLLDAILRISKDGCEGGMLVQGAQPGVGGEGLGGAEEAVLRGLLEGLDG